MVERAPFFDCIAAKHRPLHELFDALDGNKDGVISREEFQRSLGTEQDWGEQAGVRPAVLRWADNAETFGGEDSVQNAAEIAEMKEPLNPVLA
eukprot:2644651-Amphidinium_carterae.2